MSGKRWIVTDKGDVLSSGSMGIGAALGAEACPATETYAIENIGFIGLSLNNGRWIIRYRPGIVAGSAVVGLYQFILDFPPRPAAIAWLDGETWQLSHAANPGATIAFISYSLDKFTARSEPAPRIRSRHSALVETRWRNTTDALIGAYRQSGLAERLFSKLDDAFAGRWSLIDVTRPAGTVTITRRGTGYPPLDPRLSGDKQNYSLQGLTDPVYQQWAEDSYRTVAETARPLFEEVDATVRWHRLGDIRTRYWRAVFALEVTPTLCRLLGASGSDSSIDLGPEHIDKASQIYGGISGGHPKQHIFT